MTSTGAVGGFLDLVFEIVADAVFERVLLVTVLGALAVFTDFAEDDASVFGDVKYFATGGLACVADDAAFFDPDLGDGHECNPLRKACLVCPVAHKPRAPPGGRFGCRGP